jgi:uncharacterized protein
MRIRTHTRWIAICSVSALTLTACGDNGEEGGEAAAEGETTEEGATEEEVFISIAAGGTGGTYYPYGGALASLWSNEFDNITTSSEATGASIENVRLIHNGDAQAALIQADAAFYGLEGIEDFDEPQDIQAIAYMYPNYIQMTTTADTGIETFDDFVGRDVAIGDAGSAAELGMRIITDALGYTYDDFASTQRIGFTEMTAAFRNNQIEVGNYVGSVGLGAIQDLASTEDIEFISFSEEQMAAISEEAPFITSGEIAAGSYPGQDEAVPGIPSLANFVVVNTAMDRELVYELTRSLYEGRETLEGGHPVAADTLAENMPIENEFLPIHPGALDYFQEVGVEIPDELIPEGYDG